jgi:hypothetical protein
MAPGVATQLAVLQRIAAYSAAVRGHELGAWCVGDGCASARCTRCSAELCVYFPALQPEMDGLALDRTCDEVMAGRAA